MKRDTPEYHEAEQVETIISRRKRAQRAARGKDGSEMKADRGRPEKGSDNNVFGDDRGTDYLTARIARDHEEVREKRLRTGNPLFASVIRA